MACKAFNWWKSRNGWMSNDCGWDEMTPHKDNLMANFGFAIHQLSAQIVNGQNAPVGVSEELKSAIAVEVRAQMVPVVKEIVREVVSEVRSVVTDVVNPLYDELRDFRSRIPFSNSLLYSAGNMPMYTNGSSSAHTNRSDILVSFIFIFLVCNYFVSQFIWLHLICSFF
ncbi:unnamed protein product [Brugia timori]|uniref:t-SNARE coiled-coil homology domain-containing protein n=1 Tax=Brugia timori TaxID=42155 RepID=A0A0R3QEQ7_9BILA|nr:unnamed protein product [Brugia timori]